MAVIPFPERRQSIKDEQKMASAFEKITDALVDLYDVQDDELALLVVPRLAAFVQLYYNRNKG
jgi:hypothetical protein